MTKPCAVPTCKTGNRSEKSKRSVFRVPKDIERLKKWIEIIPGIVELKPTHVICDKHFEDKYIIREWIKRDESGRVIAQVPYKYPQLSKLAVPTRFSNDETNNETSTESSLMIPVINSVHHDGAMPVESPVNQSTEGTMITDTPHMQEDGQSLTTMEVADIGSTTMTNSTSDLHTEIASAPLSECQTQDKLFHIHSVFSERIQKGNANISACETDFATIPKFWSVGELPVQKGQCILFSYTIPRSDGGMHFPLTQKHVVLDTDRQLQYVNGCHVNTQETELEQMYNTADLMPYILEKFQKMNVCSGLGDIDVHCVPANTAFQDGAKQWRHKKCSMISKTKKCNNCTKLRKCILQQVSRMKNCPTLHRIRKLHNPVDEYKIKAMRMKRRQKECKESSQFADQSFDAVPEK
ncbi:unnamed protein product [Lasius platythorax]|uniref:THAP-type domain-containing protein n=1 Tax=Lasius platythorax TaxID=488582 RepID=A0AAV2N030_9HYME